MVYERCEVGFVTLVSFFFVCWVDIEGSALYFNFPLASSLWKGRGEGGVEVIDVDL